MNFHQFQCTAVGNLVLVPEEHAAQVAVKAGMHEGDTTNISFVDKCCLALHKFSITALIREINTPKPSAPHR